MIIRDVWHALLLAGKNIFFGGIVIFFVSSGNEEVLYALVVLLLVQSIVIYRANSNTQSILKTILLSFRAQILKTRFFKY